MKYLMLADACRPDLIAPMCRKLNCGIEIQEFHDPRKTIKDSLIHDKYGGLARDVSPIALHGCFWDLCPGSTDAMVREVAGKRFEQSYEAALKTNAAHVVYHHGYVPGTTGHEAWIRQCASFWQGFTSGKPNTMHFYIENMLEQDAELLLQVVRRIDRENVRALLDIGHAHCNSPADVLSWIDVLGNSIGYVHLHDNNGKSDEHLSLGVGTMPMLDVCNALEERAPDAIWTIETYPGSVLGSLQWLGTHGFLTDEQGAAVDALSRADE